jgi:hypothetical protein
VAGSEQVEGLPLEGGGGGGKPEAGQGGVSGLLTAGLTALIVTESAGMFLMLSTAITTTLVAAGTSASTR